MSIDRIIFTRGESGELGVHLDLDGVAKALKKSRSYSGPIVVVGPHPVEEVESYFRTIRRYPQAAFVATGVRGYDLSDILYGSYRGRVKILRRIMAFLSSYVLMSDPQMARRIDSNSLKWPDEAIRQQIVSHYVSSRKRPEGAEQEIAEFFDRFESTVIEGPVVMRKYYGGWNAEQYLTAVRAVEAKLPLILVTEPGNKLSLVGEAVHSTSVTVGDTFSAIKSEFQIPVEVIARNFRLWRASRFFRGRQRSIDLNEVASMRSFGDFLNFLLEAVSDSEPESDQQLTIPNRIVAPIMFQEYAEIIGVDHTAVTGVTYQNSLGAVRALKNLTNDIYNSGVLTNAVLGIGSCLTRMTNILERIEQSSALEEADIVEFGVEFSYFESRVINASSKLSSETMEFLLAYTGEGQVFLERFEPWQTYKAESGGMSDGLGVVNRDIAAASIRLLRSAAAEGLLDPTASSRVAEMVANADIDAPVKRASLAATSNNFGAALGRSALKGVTQATVGAAKEVGVATKKKLSETAAGFIHNHSVDLAKLAASGSSKWLNAVLKLFMNEG